nr:MAG TPA: hypothetical protein [Caudoviricetes sp.]
MNGMKNMAEHGNKYHNLLTRVIFFSRDGKNDYLRETNY